MQGNVWGEGYQEGCLAEGWVIAAIEDSFEVFGLLQLISVLDYCSALSFRKCLLRLQCACAGQGDGYKMDIHENLQQLQMEETQAPLDLLHGL